MKIEIYPTAAIGTLLLISLCHSARLTEVNGATNRSSGSGGELTGNIDTNGTTSSSSVPDDDRVITSFSERAARCLHSLRRWVSSYVDEVLAGNPDDVRFFLYPSPLKKLYAEEIRYGDGGGSLQKSNFQVGTPLKIIIHGFTKSYASESVQQIKDAYLTRMAITSTGQNLNVILVDWEPIANPHMGEELPKVGGELISYKYAVANIALVGKRIGEFIQFLIESGAVKSLRDVHIIGFSLGAHVAGSAGNTLRELNAGQLAWRVTGLDPAGPAFYQGLSLAHRSLHKTDGRFVDVIHTNMGTYGTLEVLGNADFYPNGGGPVQEACREDYEKRKAQEGSNSNDGLFNRITDIGSCSHGKAPEFFAMSILNPMIACGCDSYAQFKMGCECTHKAVFGEYCDSRTRGEFYLDI